MQHVKIWYKHVMLGYIHAPTLDTIQQLLRQFTQTQKCQLHVDNKSDCWDSLDQRHEFTNPSPLSYRATSMASVVSTMIWNVVWPVPWFMQLYVMIALLPMERIGLASLLKWLVNWFNKVNNSCAIQMSSRNKNEHFCCFSFVICQSAWAKLAYPPEINKIIYKLINQNLEHCVE